MTIVLDSSATMVWVFPDEDTDVAVTLFEHVVREGAVVPSLWKLEVANTLLSAERRGRIDKEFREAAVTDLEAMPIMIDGETSAHAWRTTLDLAASHRLTVYDAAYLELALRNNMALATLDKELARAADELGLTVIGVI
ncbi:MAG: type II toxin-antitoxin system VapC family toxin [Azospirillaceae bacterium]|nr:type II toxin-antitoxin system VapC family toxin [Azospirillaceae bacterium]